MQTTVMCKLFQIHIILQMIAQIFIGGKQCGLMPVYLAIGYVGKGIGVAKENAQNGADAPLYQ